MKFRLQRRIWRARDMPTIPAFFVVHGKRKSRISSSILNAPLPGCNRNAKKLILSNQAWPHIVDRRGAGRLKPAQLADCFRGSNCLSIPPHDDFVESGVSRRGAVKSLSFLSSDAVRQPLPAHFQATSRSFRHPAHCRVRRKSRGARGPQIFQNHR